MNAGTCLAPVLALAPRARVVNVRRSQRLEPLGDPTGVQVLEELIAEPLALRDRAAPAPDARLGVIDELREVLAGRHAAVGQAAQELSARMYQQEIIGHSRRRPAPRQV